MQTINEQSEQEVLPEDASPTSSKISKQRHKRSVSSNGMAVSPATLLRNKQAHFDKNDWNTMEVFNTLPSMYTKERWEELQAKKRSDLSLEHLYWLSRYDPKPTDGHHLDMQIDEKIAKARDILNGKINPLQTTVFAVSKKLTLFQTTMADFRKEVS